MELLAIAVTIFAGVAMGAINNLAGGAGVFGLLAFEHVWGMPLNAANPTARVAAIAIGTFAFLGFVRAGKRPPPHAWWQGALAVPGALLGSHLARDLPDLVFRGYLAIVLVLLLWQQLRPRAIAAIEVPRAAWIGYLGCFLIGLHMGYVQIGTGLVATLLLASTYQRDMLAVNMAKSTVVITTSIASVATFASHGAIQWVPGLALAVGAAIGSYFASGWSVAKGANAVRRIVVVVAVLTLVEQLRQIVLLLA